MKRNTASFVEATAWEEQRDTFTPNEPSKPLTDY
jgi:hypothetical protein